MLSLRFDTIRSIARRSGDSSLVTLLDGGEIALAGTREVGRGTPGLTSTTRATAGYWSLGGASSGSTSALAAAGPPTSDFARGRALTGHVTTRGGRRLTGRLVYDLDESETTQTLDAPSQGVDYPFLSS
ncbi:MAG: hypothetical protein ABIS06_10535 [Vicinamibacterales bacterium]